MPEARAPESPLEVTRYIGDVLRRKRALLDTLHTAELDARAKRRAADELEAHTYLRASGSIPERKYTIQVTKQVQLAREEADVAEVMVAHLRRMVAHCSDEIDGARTAAATLRAELSTLGLGAEGG